MLSSNGGKEMEGFKEYKFKCRCGRDYKSINYRSSFTGELLPIHSCCPRCVDRLCGSMLKYNLITKKQYQGAMQ